MFERILRWVVFVAGLVLVAWIPIKSVSSHQAGPAATKSAAQPAPIDAPAKW